MPEATQGEGAQVMATTPEQLNDDMLVLLRFFARDPGGFRDAFYCKGLSVHFRGPCARLKNRGLITRSERNMALPLYRITPAGEAALHSSDDRGVSNG